MTVKIGSACRLNKVGMLGTVIVSRRMATEEGAKLMGGQIVPDTAVEIDAGLIETGEQWTRLEFDPDRV
jgi:hypothetical protein